MEKTRISRRCIPYAEVASEGIAILSKLEKYIKGIGGPDPGRDRDKLLEPSSDQFSDPTRFLSSGSPGDKGASRKLKIVWDRITGINRLIFKDVEFVSTLFLYA